MSSNQKTVQKYILVLFIISSFVNLYSFFYNAPKNSEQQDDHELDFTVELHVNEPVIQKDEIHHLSTMYNIAVTHAPLNWTEKDMQFFKSAAGETVFSQLAVIPEVHEKPDFTKMVAAERLFKSLFMYFDPIISQNADIDLSIKHEKSWELYQRLESTLYPWIYPYWKNAFHINNQTTGKGIVMCVGNDQFKFAISSIRAIREVLGCNLPIEIFFVRDDDLSMAKRSYLATEFSDIRLMKLEDSISKYYTRFGGWAMKPFAILASKFTEVIMMDADVFFFQDPSLLLNDAGYKKTGSLFFYDRTLLPNWEKGPDWLRSFLPTMSSLVNETRWFRGTSSHEQESGVVVMNKKKSLLGLLSTCKLNALVERDEVVYKHVYGDKETYWVGHEISQTPYSFVKSFSAVIGDMGRGGDDGETTQVCGNQLHLDAEGIPLWLNGALYRDKSKTPLEYLNFTYYAEGDDWEFKTHCLKSQDKIYEFPSKQRDIALASVEINIQMLEDTRLVEEGKWNS